VQNKLVILLLFWTSIVCQAEGLPPLTHKLTAIKPILPAPSLQLKDSDGDIVDIKGKVILLNFWATWCPPCLNEIPGFIELQEEYGEQGFQIVGVAVDDEKLVSEFSTEMKINYTTVQGEFEAIELSSRYGNLSGGLPYSVFISREGEISDKITGELDKIRAEKILKRLGIKS